MSTKIQSYFTTQRLQACQNETSARDHGSQWFSKT